MYFPYFRGKQYELITLREMASVFASGKIIPILEPVKENHSGLQKCIGELKKANARFIFIVNPKYGDFKNDNSALVNEIVEKDLKGYANFQLGYIIDSGSELSDIVSSLKAFSAHKIALVHYGYPEGAVLAEELKTKRVSIETHVYIDSACGKLYRRYFKGAGKPILVKDGFNKEKNADYPDDELFSELHLIYPDEGVEGFGDFLTVGDDYAESGGPAYAIAIHVTYFKKDQVLHVRHFKSDRTDSPADPAGKFLEALEKLVEAVDASGSPILQTDAIREFKKMHSDGHFPGLGYVKKLSMKHHIELMQSFLK